MKKDFYIYNMIQSNFFLSRGLSPVEVGFSSKNKKVYLKFIRNEASQKVFDEWCNLCESLKQNAVLNG
jgi:hypothetical protein